MEKEVTYFELLQMIQKVKKCFESQLEARLNVMKVGAPLFVKGKSGLQDDLSGKEEPIHFKRGKHEYEIVHSLAKWKREALFRYSFPYYQGLYTEMRAIRKDEKVDKIHSFYVEQWDFEIVIKKEDRTLSYLEKTVTSIYKALRSTLCILKKEYPFLTYTLPKKVYFITALELEKLYPSLSSKKREELITKKYQAVFVIGIGDKLKSGKVHELRSPDYDDWKLNGDLLLYDKKLGTVEVCSMGIRVDEVSLVEQLKKSSRLDKLKLPYHEKIIKGKLPYTIGGGIGISRVCMLLLGRSHICEVQASSWDKTFKKKVL